MAALSYAALFVLQALAQGHRFGFDVMDATGLPSGTVYPALRRLEAQGFVESNWEGDAEARRASRPRRRYLPAHQGRSRQAGRGRGSLSRRLETLRGQESTVSRALANSIVRVAAWLAPPRLRARWREEWLAELDATPAGHLGRALGAPWDALAARWTTTNPSATAGWRSGWATDLRQTTRALRRSPGHVALVVACLGVGLAASIGVFSLVNSLLYGDQPGIRDRQSLVRIHLGYANSRGAERIAGGAVVNANPLTLADFAVLRDHGPALSSVAAEGDLDMAVILDGEATGVAGALVSGEYFATLGTTAQVGRLLTAADDLRGAAPVAVVGDYFWRTHLDGRPDVIGHSLIVSGRDVTIVGVAPSRFSGLQPIDPSEGAASGLQLWLPLALAPGWPGVPPDAAAWLNGMGRLAPGATRESALAQLNVAARRIETANPSARGDAHAVIRPHGFGPGDSPTDVLALVVLFLSVPLSVLAIACANIANLQLARATDRTRELAVRLSLGGSRFQIVRLLVLESLLLTGTAVMLGAAGAIVARRFLAATFPMAIPLDWRVGTFAIGLAAVVTILTGLAPAWLVMRRAIAAGLGASGRTGGPAHARLRHGSSCCRWRCRWRCSSWARSSSDRSTRSTAAFRISRGKSSSPISSCDRQPGTRAPRPGGLWRPCSRGWRQMRAWPPTASRISGRQAAASSTLGPTRRIANSQPTAAT